MDTLLVFAFGLMLGMLAGMVLLAMWFRLTITEIKKFYDALPQDCATCPLLVRNLHAVDIIHGRKAGKPSEERTQPE